MPDRRRACATIRDRTRKPALVHPLPAHRQRHAARTTAPSRFTSHAFWLRMPWPASTAHHGACRAGIPPRATYIFDEFERLRVAGGLGYEPMASSPRKLLINLHECLQLIGPCSPVLCQKFCRMLCWRHRSCASRPRWKEPIVRLCRRTSLALCFGPSFGGRSIHQMAVP